MEVRRLGLCCFGFMAIGMAGMAWAEDGELFPDVKYEEEVQAPVSKPEQPPEKPKALPEFKLPTVVGPEGVPEREKELEQEPVKVE